MNNRLLVLKLGGRQKLYIYFPLSRVLVALPPSFLKDQIHLLVLDTDHVSKEGNIKGLGNLGKWKFCLVGNQR